MRTDEELRAAIADRFWWHDMELRPGIATPGPANVQYMLTVYGIPEDLTGKTVLDIGCWDGFYSFECERRGAKRVVASDLWEPAGRGGFDLAREELGSKVTGLQADVYGLPAALAGERFDLVLFLGVLYHLKHPLLALEQVAACVKPGGKVIADTMVMHAEFPLPVMAYFRGTELTDDPTNWWAPNPVGMTEMLKTAGFADAAPHGPVYYGNRQVFHAVKLPDEDVASQAERETRERRKYQNALYRNEGDAVNPPRPLPPSDPPSVEVQLWTPDMGGKLAFDVGARKGENFGHIYGLGYTHIVACEPQPDSFAQLMHNFSDLPPEWADRWLGLRQAAISDHNGTVDLAEVPMAQNKGEWVTPGTRGMEWSLDDWSEAILHRVPCATLDQLAADSDWPDLVVIDTEGHEALILDGAPEVLQRGCNWIIEFHTPENHDYCRNVLADTGHEVVTIRHPHYPEGSAMFWQHGWLKARRVNAEA